MTSQTLQNTATATAANNIASNITYKTSLMRTHAGYGREDMNIEDIHCQIVMRVQRNRQILHELEGGPLEKAYHEQGETDSSYISRTNSQHKNLIKGKTQEVSVILVSGADMDILGPDYCNRRPVFLPPNQTRMPINGTMNLQHLAASAYPLSTGKSQPNALIKGQVVSSNKVLHQ